MRPTKQKASQAKALDAFWEAWIAGLAQLFRSNRVFADQVDVIRNEVGVDGADISVRAITVVRAAVRAETDGGRLTVRIEAVGRATLAAATVSVVIANFGACVRNAKANALAAVCVGGAGIAQHSGARCVRESAVWRVDIVLKSQVAADADAVGAVISVVAGLVGKGLAEVEATAVAALRDRIRLAKLSDTALIAVIAWCSAEPTQADQASTIIIVGTGHARCVAARLWYTDSLESVSSRVLNNGAGRLACAVVVRGACGGRARCADANGRAVYIRVQARVTRHVAVRVVGASDGADVAESGVEAEVRSALKRGVANLAKAAAANVWCTAELVEATAV